VLVIAVVLLAPYGLAGVYHRLTGLRGSEILPALGRIPHGIRSRIQDTRESLVWTWEGMPWNRDRVRVSDSKEGG
jgi:hypothetical protein